MKEQEKNSSDFTILDYVDEIKVSGNVFAEPANEYWALICLREGLNSLFHIVAKYEGIVNNRLKSKGRHNVWIIGNAPTLEGIPLGLLTCMFHWYAISACQYVKTVGAIAYLQDKLGLKKEIDF